MLGKITILQMNFSLDYRKFALWYNVTAHKHKHFHYARGISREILHFWSPDIVESDRTIHKTSCKLTPMNLRSSLGMVSMTNKTNTIKKAQAFPIAITTMATQITREYYAKHPPPHCNDTSKIPLWHIPPHLKLQFQFKRSIKF